MQAYSCINIPYPPFYSENSFLYRIFFNRLSTSTGFAFSVVFDPYLLNGSELYYECSSPSSFNKVQSLNKWQSISVKLRYSALFTSMVLLNQSYLSL